MRASVRLAISLAALPLSACGYGVIPAERDRAEAAWSDVQHQYRRRAELVPALIANIQAAGVQAPIDVSELSRATAEVASVAARSDVLAQSDVFAAYEGAQVWMGQALRTVSERTRAHPQLQANQAVASLQARLEGPELRIAVARRDYNEAARRYNDALADFPTTIWANTLYAGSEPLPLADLTLSMPSSPRVDAEIVSQ